MAEIILDGSPQIEISSPEVNAIETDTFFLQYTFVEFSGGVQTSESSPTLFKVRRSGAWVDVT